MEYDKAIYHLALSLLDTKLKRFLKANISDELDDSDFLLNKIYNSFSTINLKKKANKLQVKQMNSMNESFSQKDIGILINTRYCRLVHYYYIFFKNLRKLNKLNDNKIQEQFMSTTFHTLNYYHKILIQYIFLSYAKNDLVKIGESILNYWMLSFSKWCWLSSFLFFPLKSPGHKQNKIIPSMFKSDNSIRINKNNS